MGVDRAVVVDRIGGHSNKPTGGNMSCSPLSVRVCACCASAQCARVRLLCERAVCVCVRKWFKMVQNGTKRFKMCQNGQKWSKKAKNGKKQ